MSVYVLILILFVLFILVLFAVKLIRLMKAEASGSQVVPEIAALERLPYGLDGLRILYISDIHRRKLGESVFLSAQEQGGAELVLVGGDVREEGVPLELVEANMRLLGRIAPVYAVYGNHDHDEDIAPLADVLERAGVTILVNRHIWISLKGRPAFKLAGVDDPRLKKDRLQEALDIPLTQNAPGSTDSAPFTILLAHDPIIAHRNPIIAADLILSGHTHGGQIIVPLLGPAMRTASVRRYPSGWFDLPGWSAGQHKNGPRRVRMLVSPGYGTSKAPIRWNCPPVIHLLTVERELSPS